MDNHGDIIICVLVEDFELKVNDFAFKPYFFYGSNKSKNVTIICFPTTSVHIFHTPLVMLISYICLSQIDAKIIS